MTRGRGFRRNNFLTEEELNNKPEVTPELIKRIFSYLKPYWKQMFLVLIAISISSGLHLLPSILTGKMLDEGIIGRNLNVLIRMIVLSVAVMLGGNLVGVFESYLNAWVSQHISYDMRNAMFRHLQKMPQSFFTTNNQGDIITRMTSDISGVEHVITTTITNVLANVITLVFAVIIMVRKNWLLAAIAVILVPILGIPTRAVGKTRWNLTKESQECNDEINGILNETLSVSGQMLVKLFCREETEYEKYRAASERRIHLYLKESMAGRWFVVVLSTVTSIGPTLLYLVGGILIIKYNAGLTVGDITVMVGLLGRMYGPVNTLLGFRVEWIRSMALFTRIFEYFDMPVEIESKENAIVPETAEGTVTFEHVTFSYNSEREVLKDISFDLKQGHSIAIVGPSGSGKSTMINLIPRFYDVDQGSVKFDGVDVRDLDLKFLRRNIGVVTQDTYLFNGTIRDNLLYAKADATDEELEDACRKANIHDFIIAQPDGYDTIVGNRGLKLSGGEKQRISIARVLLKNPALLIFDEATASLDSISESKIQQAIDPLVASRTSILIAHRLSTILAADEILVIKDGKIAERGNHAELVQAGGVYTELYETQFAKAAEMENKIRRSQEKILAA